MPVILYTDTSPFAGGAQESFQSIIEHSENCALMLGEGLYKRNPKKHSTLELHTRHWGNTPIGMLQFIHDWHKNSAAIEKFISSTAPDIIHANTIRSAMLLLFHRIPCPFVIHDRDMHAPKHVVKLIADKLKPHIIGISATVLNKWNGLIPPERLHVLANGFDFDSIRKTPSALLPQPHPIAILAADFEQWKQHDIFIEAIKLARQSNPDIQGIIRGRIRSKAGENLLNRLMQQAAGNDAITFITEPGPALPYIATADCLVTCSDNEPFGRTAIEALALGKKVISMPTSLAPEIISSFPEHITICKDAASIANALLTDSTISSTPDLSAFSIQHMMEELELIYNQL